MSRLPALGMRLVATVPLTLCLLTVGACDKSSAKTRSPALTHGDATDVLTRDLLDGLAANDRQAALSQATSALVIDLDDRSVAIIARTFRWLGALESLAPGSSEAVEGGLRRRYVASFSRGELSFHVTVIGGKVEGLEFDEGQWAAYEARALEASGGALKLTEFRFVGPDGAAVTSPADPASISYAVVLDGLDAQFREHHVTIGKLVYDAEGNEVYRQDAADNIRFPQGEEGTVGATITGNVAVVGPGSYELELQIHDLVGGQDLTHRVPFVIAEPVPED